MSMEANFFTKKAETIEDPEKVVAQKIEKFKELPVIEKAFEMLDRLPKDLKYHVKKHTEDVLHEAILFGIKDGLSEADLEKNAFAASWHDIGYLIRQDKNEEIAAFLIKREDSISDSSSDIADMIMDTKVVNTVDGLVIKMTNPMSAYLLDADVSNFGRSDFRANTDLYAQELGKDFNNKQEKIDFLELTLKLLKNHEWHTNAAQELRQEQKLKNIKALEKEIAELKG